jgi:hypothetical protein
MSLTHDVATTQPTSTTGEHNDVLRTAKPDPLPFVGGEDLTQLYEYRPQLFQRQPQLLRIRVRLFYVGDLPIAVPMVSGHLSSLPARRR